LIYLCSQTALSWSTHVILWKTRVLLIVLLYVRTSPLEHEKEVDRVIFSTNIEK